MSEASMSDTIDVQQSAQIIAAMAQAVTARQDELSALDSTVGDGDHGHNIAKALRQAAQQVAALDDPTPEAVWRTAGKAVQNSVGGASGLLFGAFFTGAGRSLKETDRPAALDVAEMLAAGLAAVQKRGKAQPGDKTMVDALAPAAEAAQAAAAEGFSAAETVRRAADAAQIGAESTREMTARHGRAKFLGERARGYQDAGATSVAVMLAAWADLAKGAG